MDLSVYITELLNEHGTISIPKIGVFKQVRMRGYYNAEEGKLYPPYFQTEFKQQPVEDDSLLQYLTAKSKVSASSAKYFMDKYLQNILQQAEIGEVMLGKIGWLSKENEVLSFRPATADDNATAAFGFEPVSIKTEVIAPVAEQPSTEDIHSTATTEIQPVAAPAQSTEPIQQEPAIFHPVTAPLYSVEKDGLVQKSSFDAGPVTANSPLLRQHQKPESQPVVTATPAQPIESNPVTPVAQQPEEVVSSGLVDSDPVKPSYLKAWFYGILLTAAAIAAFLYFYQKSAQQDKAAVLSNNAAPAPSMDSVVVKTPPVTPPVVKDTTAALKTKAESVVTAGNKPMPASTEFAPEVETQSAVAPVLVNTNNYKFVLMSGAFGNEEAANKVVARYKAIGVPAAILKNVSHSKYVKVTLGFFKTYTEGQAAKIRLVKLKHLRSSDLYVETLRTKKK